MKKTTEQDNDRVTTCARDRYIKTKRNNKKKDNFVLTVFPHIVIDFNRGRHFLENFLLLFFFDRWMVSHQIINLQFTGNLSEIVSVKKQLFYRRIFTL